HNITNKTQQAFASGSVQSQISYNYPYSYGGAQPHGPTAIGPFTISHDADGNQTKTLTTGSNTQSQYLYDEENRLACANSGQQTRLCSPGHLAEGIVFHHPDGRQTKINARASGIRRNRQRNSAFDVSNAAHDAMGFSGG